MWVVGSNIVIGLYSWTYGQCCVFSMWVVGSNIVIGVLPMWVVGSNIVIGLYSLDIWSVLCVLYVGGGI